MQPTKEHRKNLSESLKKGFENGRIPWNKGLKKETDERVKLNIERRNKTMHKNNAWAMEKNPRWKDGRGVYQKIAINHYGRKCMDSEHENNDKEYKRDFVVHHKDRDHSNNKLSNLIVLCYKCHKKRHPQKCTDYQKRRASETHKNKPKSKAQRRKMSEARTKWWANKKTARG